MPNVMAAQPNVGGALGHSVIPFLVPSPVCLFIMIVSPVKTTEPIEMPFGIPSGMGPRSRFPVPRVNFKGKRGDPL